ncbi:MAG: phosphoribosyl-AMP cyclohydrolase [Candidatus Ratteibacteria bacterium]|jgi:phosphoribosyl-AMP cyclohydrolase
MALFLHKGRKEDMEDLLKEIRLNEAGLFPAIVRDEKGTVLMLAWMNREAFEKTISTGKAHFWSRSRKKLWLKGESSGHVQEVKEIRLDCDGDALLLTVHQHVAACHTGYYSCFYRHLKKGAWNIEERKVFDPEKVKK